MQAHIAPMGKLAKTDETLLAKHHGLRKVSRDRNQLCNHGGVAEWSNAPVLKTGIPQGIVGSNPTPSARAQPTTGRLGSGISGAGRKLFASAASKGSNAHTSCITMYLQKQNTGGGILDTRIDCAERSQRTRQCVYHALYIIRNPEEDFCNPARLERSESNPTSR